MKQTDSPENILIKQQYAQRLFEEKDIEYPDNFSGKKASKSKFNKTSYIFQNENLVNLNIDP